MATRERVSNKKFNAETGEFQIDFLGKAGADGKRPVTNVLKFSVADLGMPMDVFKNLKDVARNCFGNGGLQKVGDSYADSDDGTPFENAKAMVEQLRSGTWAQRGGGGERISYLVRALVELTKKPEDAVRTWLEGLTAEQRKSLPDDPQVAPVMARLKVEDAQKKAAEVAEKTKGAKPAEGNLLAGLIKSGKK